MHLPESEPRSSIYYRYDVHPFRRPPEMSGQASDAAAVVVGAGPIGLVSAINLARFGVRCIVLEQELQVSHGSRALALTRRSMEILQQAGVAAPFLAKGLQWNTGRTFFRGKEVYEMLLPHDPDDRFQPMLNLQQQYIEQYLVEAAQAHPLIDVRWGQKLVGLDQDAKHVTLRVDTPEGEYDLVTDWLVAADGGRSAVRQMMGLRMEGRAYAGGFVIMDIRADLDLPTERLCFFDPDWNPGANVLVHREPEGIWRLDYRVPEGETAEQALEPERAAARIDRILEMVGQKVPWELDWATVYSASTLTLANYVHGRVAFVGDAAHLLPIFGVRGANTGLQDCENLAWKLALVAQGRAPRSLLESYSTERVRAAREICEEAGKSTRFMTPPTQGYRIMRDAVLSFTLSEDFPKDLLHWRTSRPHAYSDSALNSFAAQDGQFAGGIRPGETISNMRLGSDDFLFDHLATGFQLLFFAGALPPRGAAAEMLKVAADMQPRVNRVVIADTPSDWTGLADFVVIDAGGRIARKYAAHDGAGYLVRPDLHVCARWQRFTEAELRHALGVACGTAMEGAI